MSALPPVGHALIKRIQHHLGASFATLIWGVNKSDDLITDVFVFDDRPKNGFAIHMDLQCDCVIITHREVAEFIRWDLPQFSMDEVFAFLLEGITWIDAIQPTKR